MRIFLFPFVLLALGLSGNAQFNPQTRGITNTFFPEPEHAISTPAFAKESGYTNYAEMMTWLETTLKPYPSMATLSFFGKSQKGKAIPMLTLSLPNGRKKTRIWMQGGLHGDEPAGTEAMLYLIEKLASDTSLHYLLQDLELAIVPMANIDGYEKQTRASANGIDLNRDQTKLQAPESIALKLAFNQFNPAVTLDFHEYRPYRKDFTRFGRAGITSIYDAMFLYSGNLNVPQPLRDLTKAPFVDNAKKALDEQHLRHHDYITTQKYGGQVHFNQGSVHSRSSASSYALAGTVSTLLEIRGVGIGRSSFKRRILSSYLIALSYLKTAHAEQAQLKQLSAILERATQDITVTSSRKTSSETIQAIDLATEKEIALNITLHNALESKPLLQRKRPNCYLLLPTETAAAYRLGILGLKVDTLQKETTLEVESYNTKRLAEEQPEEEEESESITPASLITVIKKAFPAGTFVVRANQQRAGLAFEVLEPENTNSFVEGKIIKASSGAELPIYRYMGNDSIK